MSAELAKSNKNQQLDIDQKYKKEAEEYQHQHTMRQIAEVGKPSPGQIYINEKFISATNNNEYIEGKGFTEKGIEKLKSEQELRDYSYTSPVGASFNKRFGPGSEMAKQAEEILAHQANGDLHIPGSYGEKGTWIVRKSSSEIRDIEERNIAITEQKIRESADPSKILGALHFRNENGIYISGNITSYYQAKFRATGEQQYAELAKESVDYRKEHYANLAESKHQKLCASLGLDPDNISIKDAKTYNREMRLIEKCSSNKRLSSRERRLAMSICDKYDLPRSNVGILEAKRRMLSEYEVDSELLSSKDKKMKLPSEVANKNFKFV